jgi:hypothetical protein
MVLDGGSKSTENVIRTGVDLALESNAREKHRLVSDTKVSNK